MEECQTPEHGDIVTDFTSIADAIIEIESLRQRLGLAEMLRNQLRKQRDHFYRELSVRAGYLSPAQYALKMGCTCFGKGEKRNA
jgi:hypothetical protein